MLNLVLSKLVSSLFASSTPTLKKITPAAQPSAQIITTKAAPVEEPLTERQRQLRLQYERIAQRQGIIDAEDKADQRWRS